MNITLLKSSRKFPAIHYSEKKIKQSEKAGLTGKDAKVELVDIRNFPIANAASLSAAAKEQVMIDYCSKSLAKLLQLHFAVSCRRHENTEEELRAAAVELLDKMGLSHSPAILYIHRDTENLHLHVVSTKCDENGHRIKDWRSIMRMRDILDKFEGRNAEKDARRAVELASSYHFTQDRHFISLLSSMGYHASVDEVEPANDSTKDSKKDSKKKSQGKSSGFPQMLFLFRNRKRVGEVPMDKVKKLMEANRQKAVTEADTLRAKELSAIMHDYRKRESADFYTGKKPVTKLDLIIDQKVRAVDSIHNDRMAERGIMRNDLYQMALFQRDMKKKFGLDIVYNVDRTGVPNGFIVLDHQSKRVWRGSDLGFRFKDFLRPDENALKERLRNDRCSEALHLRDKEWNEGFQGPVAMEVRTPKGGTFFLFYGRPNVAKLPDDIGKSFTDDGIPVRWLTHEEMDTLKARGIEARVHRSMYDAVPFVDPSPKDEKPATFTTKEDGQIPSKEESSRSHSIIEHVGNGLESTAEAVAAVADNAADKPLDALDAILSIQSGEGAHISTGGKKDTSKKKGKKRG